MEHGPQALLLCHERLDALVGCGPVLLSHGDGVGHIRWPATTQMSLNPPLKAPQRQIEWVPTLCSTTALCRRTVLCSKTVICSKTALCGKTPRCSWTLLCGRKEMFGKTVHCSRTLVCCNTMLCRETVIGCKTVLCSSIMAGSHVSSCQADGGARGESKFTSLHKFTIIFPAPRGALEGEGSQSRVSEAAGGLRGFAIQWFGVDTIGCKCCWQGQSGWVAGSAR